MSNARELAELSGSYGTGGFVGMKNRIINGAMRVQQRGTAAVTVPASFPVDRFFIAQNSSSTWSAQVQSDGPTGSGFVNSVKFTQTTGQTVSAGNVTEFIQRIEGNNVTDLAWGTASAQPITLAFWVKSSLTGTFGVSFINSAYNRSYVASYTINSANTWEYKTISIAGDQSGTWLTDTGIGLNVGWDLGVGTTFSTSAGSWSAGDYEGLTGGVKLAATTGATWSITGVQLEKGSTATSFDYRPYGTELALCQRYLPAYNSDSAGNQSVALGMCLSSTGGYFVYAFQVPARVAPTGISVSSASHFQLLTASGGGSTATNSGFTWSSRYSAFINFTVASGLVQGNATHLIGSNSSSQILFTGCEL
jgi:hypothetical protein